MPKPNEKSTVAQLKQYIRDHKELNIRLGQNKPELIADLKKTGNWEGSSPVKKAPVKKAPVKKAPVKKAPVKTTTTKNIEYDPMNSPNAPLNKWVPCQVFNFKGKNPKQYECQYVLQKHKWVDPRIRRETPESHVVWIKDNKGIIIAAGDMGHLEYDSKVRVTQFRFSNEKIEIFVPEFNRNSDAQYFGGFNRILSNNEEHRLLKNQPQNIQNYYKKKEFRKELQYVDFAYDIVRKFKYIKIGKYRAKLSQLKNIPELLTN
jgi:hypothetical protein